MIKILTRTFILFLAVVGAFLQPAMAAVSPSVVQKPHVIVVSSLTCFGCYKFLVGEDHKKIQAMEQRGLITLEYMPYIHDGACLVGTCVAAAGGPDSFVRNYLFLMEKQKEWTLSKWQEDLKKLAVTELNLPQQKIDDAFRENSDIQNHFLLNHISFTKKHSLKFVPCLIVNGIVIEAEYDKLMQLPIMQGIFGVNGKSQHNPAAGG